MEPATVEKEKKEENLATPAISEKPENMEGNLMTPAAAEQSEQRQTSLSNKLFFASSAKVSLSKEDECD